MGNGCGRNNTCRKDFERVNDVDDHTPTSREWETVIRQLEVLTAKIDAIASCLAERVTRQECDHYRDQSHDALARIHDRIDTVEHTRVSWSTTALVTVLSSLLCGVAVGLVMLLARG